MKRIFALDLSGVATIVSNNGHSKPLFFKAEKIMRKLERLLKEIYILEKKIDHIADQIHSTKSRKHRERLEKRLKHSIRSKSLLNGRDLRN